MSLDYADLQLAAIEPYSPGISTTSSSLPPRSFSDTGYGDIPASYGFNSELPTNPAEHEEAAEAVEEDEPEAAMAVEAEPESPAPAPKRKRGRPRLSRPSGSSSSSTATATATKSSSRIPHTEVERKYRNALNAEMERLRANIPTLPQPQPQRDGADAASPLTANAPKPSKAVVLAAAVDYIKQLEAETEKLAGENAELKRGESYSAKRGRRRYDY